MAMAAPTANRLRGENRRRRGAGTTRRVEATASVGEGRLGKGGAAPQGDHPSLGAHRAGVAAHGLEIGDLELQGGEALPAGEPRLDGAAAGRVEQGGGVTAVDRADRIVNRSIGDALEDDAAVADLDEVEA